MKRFTTQKDFMPLIGSKTPQGIHFEPILKNEKPITFKTRKGVEAYCQKNDCIYAERKNIFYR